MNNDIKEILDKLKDDCWYDELDLTGDKWIELKQTETKQILDYITNLQEELKYQKQAEQEYNEKHTKLMKKYKELQERKDKAIKYLEQPYRDNFDYSKAELLNILQGEDNE